VEQAITDTVRGILTNPGYDSSRSFTDNLAVFEQVVGKPVGYTIDGVTTLVPYLVDNGDGTYTATVGADTYTIKP